MRVGVFARVGCRGCGCVRRLGLNGVRLGLGRRLGRRHDGFDGRRGRDGGGRGVGDALFERRQPLLLVGAELGEIGVQRLQTIAILLRLPEDVAQLPLKRVEALVEGDDRRLSRRRLVRKSGGGGRASAWEHLPLHFLELAFETLDPLFGSRRLALGEHRSREGR